MRDEPEEPSSRITRIGAGRSSPLTAPSATNRERPEASRGRGDPLLAAESATPRFAVGIVAAVLAIHLAIHLYVLLAGAFGVHRDEFLYFAMGRHLRFWRMDFPPLIAAVANASRAIFGETLAAVRVPPMLEGAALIVLAAAIARELGGRRFAQGLAAGAVLASPLFLRASTLFQPVILDQLWWTLALWALVRLRRSGDHRWWWAIGAALGLGLLTKFSIAFVGVGLLAALLLGPERRMLRTPWPWLAAALALAIGSPSIAGQLRLGFPVVGQMQDLQQQQLAHVTWWSFVAEQPRMLAFVAWGIAATGLAALVAWRPLAAYRVVALTCLVAFLLLLALHGKAYYAGPIYPTLLAAGAVVLERVRGRVLGPALRWGTIALMVALGVVGLPLAVPVLSVEGTARWAARIGGDAAVRTNRGGIDRLPQDYADMLGWEEQARALALAYRSLTPAEQGEAVIAGDNYGEAGAAEFYRARYGLPPVVSTAGSFWFFGPGDRPGRVVITIGETPESIGRLYGDVREAVHLVSPWSVAEERDVPVLICRQPKTTLQALWPHEAGRH